MSTTGLWLLLKYRKAGCDYVSRKVSHTFDFLLASILLAARCRLSEKGKQEVKKMTQNPTGQHPPSHLRVLPNIKILFPQVHPFRIQSPVHSNLHRPPNLILRYRTRTLRLRRSRTRLWRLQRCRLCKFRVQR